MFQGNGDISQLKFDILPPIKKDEVVTIQQQEEEEEDDKPVNFKKLSDKILEVNKKCWGCENGFYYTNTNEKLHDLFQCYMENKGKLSEEALARHIYRWHRDNIYNDQEDDTPMENRRKWPIRSIKRHIKLHMSDEFTLIHNTLEDLRVLKTVCKDTIVREVAKNKKRKKKKNLDSEFLKQYLLILDKESKLSDRVKEL